MTKYLLDTGVLISVLNDPLGHAAAAALRHAAPELATSSLVMHELFVGVFQSEEQAKNLSALEKMQFPVLPFDLEDSREAGRVRGHFQAMGLGIGPYEVLIAGQALRHGLTLVTAKAREFERVPGLVCEDWTARQPFRRRSTDRLEDARRAELEALYRGTGAERRPE